MRKVQKYAFLLVGVFVLWFAAEAGIKPTQGTGRIIEDFKEIPKYTNHWSGEDKTFDDVTVKSLKHCSLLTRDYEDDHGYDSNFSVVYGVDLGDFHQPEGCMKGQGWNPITSRDITIPSASPHKAKIVHMSGPDMEIVMLYWFASKDGVTTALEGHKLLAFADRLKHGELKPSAMIRLISHIEYGDLKNTEKATLDLAATLDPYINKMLANPPVFEDTGRPLLEE